jgi:uncharacterized glyoxalase superfamily protein PhnB
MKNRSVPADSILPHVVYQDVAAAIDWLTRAFGFVEHYRYGYPAQGAQMHLGDAWIMLTLAREGRMSPAQAGVWTQMLSVFIDDVDAHFESVKSAGAKIVEDLNETMYGERQFVAEDIEGHRWLFARHARDVSPSEWGAKVAS